MQLPQQIEFMSQKWSIRTALHRELEDCVGQCDPKTNTIIIEKNMPSDVMTQTLMHELTHVIEMTLQLNLTEQQVDCLATGWLHLLRTNPHVVKLITAKESKDEIRT
jgi:hypothetical protein